MSNVFNVEHFSFEIRLLIVHVDRLLAILLNFTGNSKVVLFYGDNIKKNCTTLVFYKKKYLLLANYYIFKI